MSDPFEPDWSKAPEWANWHTVDANNADYWWQLPPHIAWDFVDGERTDTEDDWWPDKEYGGAYGEAAYEEEADEAAEEIRDIAWVERGKLDWRNSLRHRPEAR